MNHLAYNATVNELKEVAAGTRGWVSLTRAAKAIGIGKGQLRIVAEALGLEVTASHGNHGMSARRRAAAVADYQDSRFRQGMGRQL